MTDTSWEPASSWYKESVNIKGNYYHQHIVIPKSLELLSLDAASTLLDLACGQGILSRSVPPIKKYLGIDTAQSLIDYAVTNNTLSYHNFKVADVSKPLALTEKFSHASLILAIQNIKDIIGVIKNAGKFLTDGGKFVIALNHPAFRIPKYTSWDINYNANSQARRIEKYMSPLESSIDINPSRGISSQKIYDFHHPISFYSKILKDCGFVTVEIQEWISDKKSVGKHAKMENESRLEFPLFMAILAKKSRDNDPRLDSPRGPKTSTD